jgi:hypothetical protein
MMKVELYLDIFRNGIRRLGQNIYFTLRLTSIQMFDYVYQSIDQRKKRRRKTLKEKDNRYDRSPLQLTWYANSL